MKVGIFSPYFATMGGGERYVLTVAEFFSKRGDQVDIFSNEKLSKKSVQQRFNLDISKVNLLKNKLLTFGYDLFFFLSDGSIPFSLAKKNILHFQIPFRYKNQKTLRNKIKLWRFNKIICNSFFTKRFIDETYDINSQVLYPPVGVKEFFSGKKEKMILSVGRFFAPSHPKKQAILIEAFKQLKLSDWKLILIGGGLVTEEIKKLAAGANRIEVIANCSFAVLKQHYSKAKIYWHAAGYGEDLEKHPEKAEHFGMTTVEAMAAGCVPIVFAGGGQKEIIIEGKNGYFWQTTNQLLEKTLKIINNQKLQKEISENAIVRAKFFSKEKFFQELNEII
ncbi:glycosyltransferase [Candidatus Gottesmanbacteria bacterium]|nr:glycosyltransferase [Candidatus Gottesmanbacteria bacterium]